MATGWFADVQTAKPIEVFDLSNRFRQDSNPSKVNLSVGGMLQDFFYSPCRFINVCIEGLRDLHSM